MWVSIHKFMEARNLSEELSLSHTSKNTMSFLLSLMFFFNKIGEQEGRTGSAWKSRQFWGCGGGSLNIHVSKCKNNKIKNINK
jgi:hypothetical protein